MPSCRGKIQIEDDQAQLRRVERFLPVDDLQDFPPVGGNLEWEIDSVLLQGGADQVYIRRIIFR